MPKAALVTSLLVAGGALGGCSAPAAEPPPPRTKAATSAPGTPRAQTATPAVPQVETAAVRRELRALEASFDGRIGAYAIDTATGRTVGHRAGERFPLASTFKAVVAAAVLHKARTSDPGLLKRVVRWAAAEVEPYSPTTQKHVKSGLTIGRLCEAAITQSDNTAGNILLKEIGGPAGLTRYFRSLGDEVSRSDRWEPEMNRWKPGEKRDTTSPAAMAHGFRRLTAGDALNAKDQARFNAWLLANKTGGDRIRAGLPSTWKVGDKTGTGGTYGTANDVAVIWPAKAAAPIVMAVYTSRKAAEADAEEEVLAKTAAILVRALGEN
ncbi:class A beta-lactamase [Spongiactinospora gelatinilytica]|uniref:class A beta-lactamase n=1 Tax=Spongiactinospora gelatinilytica TaxID=2666298 RepID=UPI001EFF03C5|nr:class A beta-lactamase [Spongiactinospora gelatinilytica]